MDIGKLDLLNIVCGVFNVIVDIYVLVVIIGIYLFVIDLKIKKSKFWGVYFEGMICFLLELGLIKDFEGIYIFDLENLELGSDVGFLFGLDDVILDLIIMVNCVDVLSMIGVVCEVAVLIGVFLRILDVFEILILD